MKKNRIFQIIVLFVGLMALNTPLTKAQQAVDGLLLPKVEQLNKGNLNAQSLAQMANELERIALAHPQDWHAQYYAALAYIELANQAPKKEIDNLCDRADEYLKKAQLIRPNESENYVLKAYLLSARINVNAMFRGASMGRESKEQLDLALRQNPANPRAHYVRAMGIYYTPAAFGGGKKKAKAHLDASLKAYRENPPATALDPDWGRQEVEKLLRNYN